MPFYKGYLRFAGTEIINVARTMEYLDAGYGPSGVEFDAPVAHDGLAEALGDNYRTPTLDEAPWYDEAREATHGFAGVLPIDITGLDGTTQAAESVEFIRAGGTVQKARRSTRTVQVQALLVGDNSEAVDAGLLWLTAALNRTCDPAMIPGIGAALDGFVALPQAFTEAEDLDAALVATTVDPMDPGWTGYGGTWHHDDAFFQVAVQGNITPAVIFDGGFSGTTSYPDTADGGMVIATPTAYADGGGPRDPRLPQQPYARLVAPVQLTCLSRVEITWDLVLENSEPVVIEMGAVNELGFELHREPVMVITTNQSITWAWEHAEWADWRPALWVSAPGVHATVTVARRPFLDAETCIAPLRRTFADLTCVAGPTEVATHVTDDCDTKMMQVEWTWVAGNPYRYGDPTDLVVALPATTAAAPESSAPGVQHEYLGAITSAALACAAPATSPVTCAYDPAYPGFLAPPAAPVVADPGASAPANYKRSLLELDPGIVPDAGTLALQWYFSNDGTAKHGIRVRIWQQNDPDFATHTECDFVDEFWINYLDNNALMLVDGFARSVTVICDGQLTPAAGVLRGAYRGPFEYPELACGGRMFVTVDVPATEGGLTWTLTAAPQEF